MKNAISSYFDFEKLGTNAKREILAGFTTFISMCYILFVNPSVLGDAGMDKGAVFTATAISSAIGCILMGIVARYPIATAPSLGINAFFAYSVCIGMKIPWQTALAGAFVAAVIFILITIFKLREIIIDSIPQDLKYAISAGIGMFIAFIGLQDGGIIVKNSSTLVSLGSFSGKVWITIFGLVAIAILMVLRVPGAIFIGMVLATIFGIFTKLISVPTAFVSTAPSLKPTFLVALKHVGDINSFQMMVVVLTFLLVAFFDTAGTLVGLCTQAGFVKDNKIPRIGQALISDSTAMLCGTLLGTSPVGAYVESSAGIAVGGRSGLTAVTTGVLFIFGLFFSPLLAVVTTQVTAPALIIVGVLMAQNMAHIDWNKLEIAIPAFIIIATMPLTYSIADGLALGVIMYPITMVAAKRGKEVPILMYVLFFIFIGFFWVLSRG
ncbi:NCS2 family permease [Ligilactobacillus sp. WILCCON 0076]|uniref:NCS2 family permease n=1 Tax=Ligilactobacillus ubinensis TaxID=2876789 RepID=A0A9X2FLA0_9LACO|nr:NCS2 family permease [Ligilactobacillus ubinensis]MCP0887304.1 NCS2 family permease [Ligilactobacillus ubinensis]